MTRIEDRYGNVISSFHPIRSRGHQQETAYLMLSLLKNVVDMTEGIWGIYYSGTANRSALQVSVYRGTGRENGNHAESE